MGEDEKLVKSHVVLSITVRIHGMHIKVKSMSQFKIKLCCYFCSEVGKLYLCPPLVDRVEKLMIVLCSFKSLLL